MLDPDRAVEVDTHVYCSNNLTPYKWNRRNREAKLRFDMCEKEAQDFQKLTEIICALFNIDALTPLMRRQIKQYKDEYGFTLSGICKTVDYCYRLADPPMKPMLDRGIAPVCYLYDEAKTFYKKLYDVKRQMQGIDLDDCNLERTVVIQAADMERVRHKSREIDMNDLGVDDE